MTAHAFPLPTGPGGKRAFLGIHSAVNMLEPFVNPKLQVYNKCLLTGGVFLPRRKGSHLQSHSGAAGRGNAGETIA